MISTKPHKDLGSYDVIVCGGGVSGFAAAVSAARQGVRVLLIEDSGCLGGTASRSGIHFLLGGRKFNPETKRFDRVVGGLFDELTDRLIRQGDALEPNEVDLEHNYFGWYPRMAAGIPLNNEGFKSTLEMLCQESGVHLLYFTRVIAAETEYSREPVTLAFPHPQDYTDPNSGRIAQLTLSGKDGLCTVSAGIVIDATGDGDVIALSGCSFVKGRSEDGLTTPASVVMVLEHVDREEMIAYQNQHSSPKFVEIIETLKAAGKWPFLYEIVVTMQLTEPDVFLVNTCRQIEVDGTNAQSLTDAMIDGRKQNRVLFALLKEYFPGFRNARIRYITDTVGIRESRRLNGRYMVTLEDARRGRRYEDEIAATTYNWDLPDVKRPSYDPMMGNAAHPDAAMPQKAIYIPYRSLLPREVGNLLAAGRCISVEREVLGPARVMGPAMQTGQAAGTAAAMSRSAGISCHELDGAQLRATLAEQGCILP